MQLAPWIERWMDGCIAYTAACQNPQRPISLEVAPRHHTNVYITSTNTAGIKEPCYSLESPHRYATTPYIFLYSENELG